MILEECEALCLSYLYGEEIIDIIKSDEKRYGNMIQKYRNMFTIEFEKSDDERCQTSRGWIWQ